MALFFDDFGGDSNGATLRVQHARDRIGADPADRPM